MWKNLTKNLYFPVFIPSVLTIFIIALIGIFFPDKSNQVLIAIKEYISYYFGWVYILSVSLFILFLLLISGSRLGDIKLGNDNDVPEYSFLSWFSMLFASGMGIGLMYFGVAEPISHYLFFKNETIPESNNAKNAIMIAFYHWGIHAWAIYTVMGLALAYFGFRYKKPLTVRSGFYPILKEHSDKLCGDIIDIIALFSTVFGVCTSLGFGALQINAGLIYLGIFPEGSTISTIFIIVFIMFIVTISVVIGVSKGMKNISNLNLLLAFLLLFLVAVLGPTRHLLTSFTENIGFYLKNLVEMSFKTFAYDENKQDWLSDWTLLYWAWWLSWAPFVGLFIAKISKGRTVREFILGVLFIPSLFNFLWMSVFGNSAIWFDQQNGSLSNQITNTDHLIFYFLENYPLGTLLCLMALVIIMLFFITSADSGINVINTISSKGNNYPTLLQNLFWIFLIIILSCSLLYSGGLKSLQTMTLVITLPFCIILLLLCLGIWKGMLVDYQYFSKKFTHSSRYWKGSSWKDKLNKVIVNYTTQDVAQFIAETAKPAFHLFALELKSYGVSVYIKSDNLNFIELKVIKENKQQFIYGVSCQKLLNSDDHYVPMTYFGDERSGYDVRFMNQEELITDILRQYELYLSLIQDENHNLKTERH